MNTNNTPKVEVKYLGGAYFEVVAADGTESLFVDKSHAEAYAAKLCAAAAAAQGERA